MSRRHTSGVDRKPPRRGHAWWIATLGAAISLLAVLPSLGVAASPIQPRAASPASPARPVPLTPLVFPVVTPACTISWTGAAGDGQWQTAGNWSTAAVPTATDYVCIGSGATAVTFTGGPTSIVGLSAQGAGFVVASGSELDLTGDSATPSMITALTLPGTLDVVAVAGELGLSGAIGLTGGSLGGAGTTTLEPGSSTTASSASTLAGAVEVEGPVSVGATLTLPVGSTFDDDTGGAVTITGTVAESGTWIQGAGTVATAPAGVVPVSLLGSATLDFTGTGTANFDVEAGGAEVLEGNVAAGQTVVLNGLDIGGCGSSAPASLTTAGSVTNAGTIDLYSQPGSGCSNGSALLVVPTGATMTNTGTLSTSGGGGDWAVQGNLTSPGSLQLASPGTLGLSASGITTLSTALSTGTPITSLAVAALGAAVPAGSVTVTSGLTSQSFTTTGATSGATSIPVASVTPNFAYPSGSVVSITSTVTLSGPVQVPSGATFDALAGVTVVDATGAVVTNGGTIEALDAWDQGGGTVSTGDPVQLDGSATLDFTGTGAGSFTVEPNGSQSLEGNVAAGQSIDVAGIPGACLNQTTTLTAAASFTNAGTITLESAYSDCSTGIPSLIVPTGATMTNTGTLAVAGNAFGPSRIEGSVTSPGAITLAAPATLDLSAGGGTSTVTLSGPVQVPSGATFDALAGVTVVDATGAVVTNGGTIEALDAWDQGGGTVSTGDPVQLDGSATLDFTGTGAGSFTVEAGGAQVLEGKVAAGQTVVLNGLDIGASGCGTSAPASLTTAGSVTNAGTIDLYSQLGCSNGSALLVVPTGATMTNTGTLSTSGGGGDWAVQGDLTNDGVLDLAPGTTGLAGDFVQGTAGSFDVPVDGTAAGQFPALSVTGNVTLAGTLALEPGSTYATSAVTGDSVAFLLYTGTRSGTFTVAAVSPQNTAPPVVTGNPGPGKTLGCSQGTFTDSPTTYTFQWNRNGSPIPGATSSTYTTQSADGGQSLTCTVTASGAAPLAGGNGFTAVYGNANQVDAVVGPTFNSVPSSATSAATEIAAAPHDLTVPTISGTATLGAVLACAQGSWQFSPTSFSYQWSSGGSPISGATSDSYAVESADAEQIITCTVTATNGTGSTAATSAGLQIGVAPRELTVPAISGTPQIGDQLSCSQGTWQYSPTGFATTWNRDGTPISGATSASYTVESTDARHALTCTVTATNGTGSTTATSAAVEVTEPPITVTPATLPQAIGANPYGQALTVCGGTPPSCEHYSASVQALVDASGVAVPSSGQYAFALVSGALPPGLSLSGAGLISGTPTEAGAFSFVVQATDPTGATGVSASYDLTVVPGLSIRTTTGSYVLGGAIPASQVTVVPNGSGAISSVRMSSGTATPYVLVGGGASGTDDEVGIQLATSGSTCTTDLEIAGSSGPRFTANGLLTSGCASTSPVIAALSPRSAHVVGMGPVPPGVLCPVGQSSCTGGVSGSSQNPLIAALISTTLKGGALAATVPASSTTTRATIQGGSYLSYVNGVATTISVTMTTLVGSTADLPAVMAVTPLSQLIAGSTSGIAASLPGPSTNPHHGNALIMSSFGFPSGTVAEAVVPDFSAAVGGNALTSFSVLAALQAQASQLPDSAALAAALQQDVAGGIFSGKLSGQPVPLGSASLPPMATANLFASGISQFATAEVNTLPSLTGVVQSVVRSYPRLPVGPPPVQGVTAVLTRIGPAAFSETLTAVGPSLADAPFSRVVESFDLEVVASS